MKYLLLAMMLSGCAVQQAETERAQDSVCVSHTQMELAQGLACSPDAPDCGFDSQHVPVPIDPAEDVEAVCHCIGGRYACFGRQP